MKKYLIKNLNTGEETLCERIELNGLGFYYTKDKPRDPVASDHKHDDLPQVVDLVDELAKERYVLSEIGRAAFVYGYKSSQSTHPFSVDDMISFGKHFQFERWNKNKATDSELLSIWQQQQPTKIYCK